MSSFGEENLKKGYEDAKRILEDDEKMEVFFQKLENKLRVVPMFGDKLANIPVLASMFRSYFKKEYTNIPMGSMIAIVSALVYFVSPIDAILDAIPIIGFLDDAFVAGACCKLIESDIEEYKKWRENNYRIMDL